MKYRNGWGASAVDAFSTALIMDNEPVWKDILDFVPKIDFSVSYDGQGVSLFETTIRYLGGLLSGTFIFCDSLRSQILQRITKTH